ncbi:MAG: PaaI family thioesterase [Pseudoprimorskyibacter sp.]|nr:PaaI family thioesterase [Pseudoprimorskyibacter sp.]
MQPKLTINEIQKFLADIFPQIDGNFEIDHLDDSGLVMRMPAAEQHLRPGGTVSGPAMFKLADVSAYVATLALIGREALAVTTNCSIDFMRKPEANRDMIARAKVLKLGRTLSVTDVMLFSDGKAEPVARATLTYSIPPKPKTS